MPIDNATWQAGVNAFYVLKFSFQCNLRSKYSLLLVSALKLLLLPQPSNVLLSQPSNFCFCLSPQTFAFVSALKRAFVIPNSTFLFSKVRHYFIIKKVPTSLSTYYKFRFTVTLGTKFLKEVNLVMDTSLYIHNLLLCCNDIENNLGPKCSSLFFCH